MQGKVKEFNDDKGFGYIEGDTGELFYFETININEEGFRRFMPNQHVEFTIYDGAPNKERVATNVTLVF